jgi:HSP20 family protein
MHENRKQVFGEFDQMLKEFDRFFDTLTTTGRLVRSNHHTWSPPTDVYETDTCAVVKIEIGGMRQEDFNVSFSQGILTVSGTRHDPSDKLGYNRLEIAYGDFMTQVKVPWAVDEDKIEAKYNLGFLYIILPKQQAAQTRIPVTMIDSE